LNPPRIASGRFAESPPHDYQRRRGHNCILLGTGAREDLFRRRRVWVSASVG
jgi:hypothetical protein